MLNLSSQSLPLLFRKLASATRVIRRRPDQFWPLVRHNLFQPEPPLVLAPADRYATWIAQHERVGEHPLTALANDSPVVSVLVIATRSRASAVASTLRSLDRQTSSAWQLVLGSLNLDEAESTVLAPLANRSDGKIVLVPDSGGTLGSALRFAADVATGEFIMVLEPGDILPQHGIATAARCLQGDSNIDILYGDEDVLDGGVRTSPQFKPEWSPELLTAYNYFGRPTIIRRSLVLEVGSFAADLGAAAEWDLHLRATRAFGCVVSTPQVRRLPSVLCHRHPASGNGRPGPQNPNSVDFREALVRHWRHEGFDAKVTTLEDGTQHAIWQIAEPPLVSVIIPNKNRADLLAVCLDGLWNKTAYPRVEIIVVDNGSTDADTMALYDQGKSKGIRVVPYNEPFNYSRACNRGASAATGTLLLFLNNDIEMVATDWLDELVRFAMRPGVGVVGSKLIYPDGVLQHAGVVAGLDDTFGLVYSRAPEYEWTVFGSPSVTRNCMGVMGACQMIRRDIFDRIGGFDEGCTIVTSDVRLCLDAWRFGYRTVYAPHAKLVHHEGKTRGHTNPEADMTRTGGAIRALGIEEDPYFHPGLSSTTPIPTLRMSAEPAPAESLKLVTERRLGSTFERVMPDLIDDAAMAVAVGRTRGEILWAPDSPGVLPDARSAARFMIDLLRRRPDIAKRFPVALSEGMNGSFATWLKSDALTRFGYLPDAAESIDAAFRADFSDEARLIALVFEEGNDEQLFLLHPMGRRALARILFGAVARGKLSKEAAWWFLLETSEGAYRSEDHTTKKTVLEPASRPVDGSSVMLVLPIDRTTSISALRETFVHIADELRALNGRVLLLRRVAADELVDSDLAPRLVELTRILPIEFIEIAFDRGIVAACNQALDRAREAQTGVFLLDAGSQLTIGSLSEMRNAAATDPMIGFVAAPTNVGSITRAALTDEHVAGGAFEARRAYDHIHPVLPRVSYVAAASGPCLYIKPSMLIEFGQLDASYVSLAAAQDEFMMRCNLRGYRVVMANWAYVHISPEASQESASCADLEHEYGRLAGVYPEFHRARVRTLDSTEFKIKRLLAGLAPDRRGRRRILFESSHLGCFFNGTFAVTAKVVASFVEQFSRRYECWLSCSPDALRFHRLDRVNDLHYAGDLTQARQKGPYLAAIRLAQPFSLGDLVDLGSLAPLPGFLMLDTIAMDCQYLDEHDLRLVWSHMARTVAMVGYISQYTADQVNRRFVIPESVVQTTILLSTDPTEYVTHTVESQSSDYLLLVGNHYSHKHLRETIDLFRRQPNRARLIVLGLKIDDEAGITGYPSGDLDDTLVEQLYRNALAIVFPTHYEGFGLPVMHALGYKKPVFARALPVFEEIRSRAPGGSNIHLFRSTPEMVDAAVIGKPWHEDSHENITVQTWASAARQIEALISLSERKLSFSTLHERVMAVNACEAQISSQRAAATVVTPVAAEVIDKATGINLMASELSLSTRMWRQVATSYIGRGVRAWLLFKPGSRPHRTAQSLILTTADLVLQHPRLASTARELLEHNPRLAQRIRNVARVNGVSRSSDMGVDSTTQASFISSRTGELHHLSADAQSIVAELRRLTARQ